ncbi:putative cytochrome P450 oxidoreductase OrdA-like protein [Xylaria sp. FL0064]|nr:putative cytochrome P450 oxidoreductase OrdA-like protein [Xylaria sp. FL0064]
MALNSSSLVLGLGIAYLAATLLRNHLNKARQPLPPGPKGLPLVGNLNDLPKPGALEAHHWLEHKKLYGPISSVTVFGKSIIIINDPQLAFELFEKRSAKYSSRPKQLFACELVGWENTLGMSPYNKRFRAMRKNLTRVIGSHSAVAKFGDLQTTEVGHFLLHVLRSPENLVNHIRKAVGAIVLKIAYGYTAEPHQDDVLISMVGDAMDKFARAAVPGAFLVDLFPILNGLPDWMPGTSWKKTARQWGSELMCVTNVPYTFVKHQMAQGTYETSFLSGLIEAGDSDAEADDINKWSAMSLYTAGADTTVSAIATFYLAMTIYPEVQRRGQEEIDRVVGKDRLPTLDDRDDLPYVDAIVKETLRWHPVAPMGLPHQSTEDDICEGYFIPKGSMLFANVWHFTHDPEVHREPEAFKPERFLAVDGHEPEPDPHKFVFGFGRRICPGSILADETLFLMVAQSLAVFNMTRFSRDGIDAECKPEFQAGVVSHPSPFKNAIKPRSLQHEELIKSLEDIYPWQQSDGKVLEHISQ